MPFNSIDFIIFLPISLIIYRLIPVMNIRGRNLFLLTISYFFYGWWDWRFLSLIILSSSVDYCVGVFLAKAATPIKRKFLLFISIFTNIGLLGFFKYYNFFIDSFKTAFSFAGIPLQPGNLTIILPVGISFYTFQTLSYTIDVYYRKLQPTKDIIAFFAFVSFFPQLVAGPIERAKNLLPQFSCEHPLSSELFSSGIKLIIWGFFMKLVLADRLAIYVNAVYNNVPYHSGLSFMVATFFFAFQIYGDFAGYSLIAIGTAKLFGFRLMKNFNRPYLASSVSQFWKRWHISLSTWFRDYLYIPLGGNRAAKHRWLLNIFITFTISGLWHGANWTFVVWGALNGIFLIVESMICNKRTGWPNVIMTFLLINFTWIFFRANHISDALHIIKTIFTFPGELYIGRGDDITAPIYGGLSIAMLALFEIYRKSLGSSKILNRFKPSEPLRMAAYSFLIFCILSLGVFGENQFIYFQF